MRLITAGALAGELPRLHWIFGTLGTQPGAEPAAQTARLLHSSSRDGIVRPQIAQAASNVAGGGAGMAVVMGAQTPLSAADEGLLGLLWGGAGIGA